MDIFFVDCQYLELNSKYFIKLDNFFLSQRHFSIFFGENIFASCFFERNDNHDYVNHIFKFSAKMHVAFPTTQSAGKILKE